MTETPIVVPFPASPYCQVRARVASIWADGPDDGTHPDWRPAAGEKVVLTPSIGSQLLTYDVGGSDPIIVTVERVDCVVGEDGLLTTGTDRLPVYIAPTDDPLLSATGWTWTASIKGKAVVFTAPTGGVVDLALFIAAPATNDTKAWVERIPELIDAAGNLVSIEAVTHDGDDMVVTLTSGSTTRFPIPGLADKADADHQHTMADIADWSNQTTGAMSEPAKTILLAGLSTAPEFACPIVFIGSSTTGSAYPNKLIARLQSRWPNGGIESSVTNFPAGSTPTWSAGVHGYKMNVANGTTNTYATESIAERIGQIQPYAVIHGIGSNDYSGNMALATYKANLIASINRIDYLMEKPVLHVLTHHQRRIGTFTYKWSDYLDVMREVAAEDPSTRIVVDASGYFEYLDWLGADWMGLNSSDNIHLSGKGTSLLAEVVYGAITENLVPSAWPAVTRPVGPTPDTTAPTAGTLTSSAISGAGFTLTVTGASDERTLNAAPYAFSVDNGTTWSAWQTEAVYNAGGLTGSTTYQARHKVRDAAGNEALGTTINVTTNTYVDTTPPTWTATFTATATTDTTATFTASALATDNVMVTGYEVTIDGTTWDAIAPSGSNFTLTGLTAETSYNTVKLRAKDGAGNYSAELSAPTFMTSAPWSPAAVPGLNLWLQGDDLTGAEGDPIATWADSSGLDNDATTNIAEPTVTSFGGHKAANFAPTNAGLVTPVSASDDERTFFVVFRMSNNSQTETLLGSSGPVAQLAVNMDLASNRRLQVRGGSAGATGVLPSANLPENTWVVGSGRVSLAAGKTEVWIGPTATSAGSRTASPTAGLVVHIGVKQTYTEQFNGEIAAIIHYEAALSDIDRKAVHDWLRAKYGAI